MPLVNRFGKGVNEKRQEVNYDEETDKVSVFLWDGKEGTRFEMPYDEFAKLSMTVLIARSGTVKTKEIKKVENVQG